MPSFLSALTLFFFYLFNRIEECKNNILNGSNLTSGYRSGQRITKPGEYAHIYLFISKQLFVKLCGQEKCAQIEYLFRTDLSLLVSFGLTILFRKCAQKGHGHEFGQV